MALPVGDLKSRWITVDRAAWTGGAIAIPRGVDPAGVASPEPEVSPSQASRRTVFLHGLWRSGSTYIWSRFRAADHTLCYYEPLHDGLRRLTAERIARDTPVHIQGNGHPPLDQPYFAEFAPLVARRGVRGYRRRFAYDQYAPALDEADPALEAYVGGLIHHARNQDRTPVLGFNRTGLRVAWLGARFDACNIHIDRDPIDIFASYLNQLQGGNYYYFTRWMQIIAGNAGYPLFTAAASRFRNRAGLSRWLASPNHFYRPVIDEASLDTLYAITFLAWAVCALHALEHCDLIIDIALSQRTGYEAGLAEAVRRETGLCVSLADMHAPSAATPLRLARQQSIERDVLDAVIAAGPGLFDKDRIRARLDQLSPRRADLLARVL